MKKILLAAMVIGSGLIDEVGFSPTLLHAEQMAASTPRVLVGATIDDIINAVEAMPGTDKTEARRGKLREIINPRFDFDEMAKRSLGSFWNEATPEEQKEFIKEFSQLLARTYLNRIETVKRGMVKVEGEEIQGASAESAVERALVKTMVNSKGSEFPINYKLMKQPTGWRVYDVVIENIGLVSNYRTEFSSIVRKEKMQGLIARLKERNAKLESQ